MDPRPYTLADAYRQEVQEWNLTDEQRALLMAFTWCLMLRMQGTDPKQIL